MMDDLAKRGPRSKQKTKHRPDISLEIWHQNFYGKRFPQIITFDPTISMGVARLEEKYAYLENIRCFDASLDDIVTGEAMHLVKASWAIYPGKSASTPHIDPKGASRYGLQFLYERGNICLFPGNESKFVHSVKTILQTTVLDSLSLRL